MRHLKFHYAKAENILCFGPDGVELHFADYGNIVQITGENLDNLGTDDDPASNASGKSSIQEILCIGLFGRTVKSPTKMKGGHILNSQADKGAVELQWDNYRILRTFRKSPNGTVTSKLRVWESPDRIWDNESKQTQGKSSETQAWIDQKIGLTHHAFCNVVIFDDSDNYAFLEADGPSKREFVENLLGLDQYREYHQNAKEYLRNQKKLVDALTQEYDRCRDAAEEEETRIVKMTQMEQTWTESSKRGMKTLLDQIKQKQTKLEQSDAGEQLAEWQQAQESINELVTEISDKESKRDKFKTLLSGAREKLESSRSGKDAMNSSLQERNIALSAIESDLQRHMDLIGKLENLQEGTKCPTCHGVISSENYSAVLMHSRNSADGCRAKLNIEIAAANAAKSQLGERFSAITSMSEKIREADQKLATLETSISSKQARLRKLSSLSKPDTDAAERVLETEITEFKRQLREKKTEFDNGSPYKEIVEQAKQEKENKEQKAKDKAEELQAAEKEVPYYEYWVKAFGDSGIRKYVIDGIIPALNARICYWMQYLIDNKMELVFNNELEETITRNENTAFYPACSKGEKRKINLAVSQAFAYVMMLNSGTCPSLVFLDEITGGGIDRASVVGVYNMLFELAKDRQVFVTTHNENLINMLQGCEKIRLRKQNDITVLL